MYDEDRIFGPLTLKQAVIAIAGAIMASLVYEHIPTYPLVAAGIVLVLTLGLIVRFKPTKLADSAEAYFRRAYVTNRKEAEKKMQKEIAKVTSLIHERRARGKQPDPILDTALKNLEHLRDDLAQ